MDDRYLEGFRIYSPGSDILDHFDRAVSETPTAIAVQREDQTLTYAELDLRSERVAFALTQLNLGPESVIGLCAHRSIEMAVALFGILKAGAAFLPLDATHPRARLQFLIDDARVELVLCDRSAASLAAELRATVLAIDELNTTPSARVARSFPPARLAYVMYTSGSTGRPKGVMIGQQAVGNYLAFCRVHYGLGCGDRALVHTSIGFDATVTSLLAPLFAGGTVVLAPDRLEDLAETIIEQGPFDLLKLTPAHLSLLPPAGETVVIGGEALFFENIANWSAPLRRIINEYGPTEATVGCAVFDASNSEGRVGAVPIGKEIPGARLYLLDQDANPVPPGVSGELYIGGRNLARGYLQHPRLTADRFVPDPFATKSDDAGARLYRTGDLALRTPEGDLVFLGRNDQQVKIRGVRIELQEIEAALLALDGVKEAAAVLQTGAQLCAFVVLAQHHDTDFANALRNALPEVMVPARILVVAKLPLTPHGKIDRAELLRMAAIDEQPRGSAPETETEHRLAAIWSEVLGKSPIAVDRSFFELGGDSISSIRVVAKAKRAGLDVTVRRLFEEKTIRALSRTLDSSPAAHSVLEPFALLSASDRDRLPTGIEDAFPLSALQSGMLFHSELEPQSGIYHDVSSFHVRVALNPEAMCTALRDVVSRHPVLRTSFALADFSEPMQYVHRVVPIECPVADVSTFPAELQQEMIDAWVQEERLRPFDWKTAPLFRVQIHQRSEGSFNFTLSFHHSILDGWSVASFLTELFSHYLRLLGHQVPRRKDVPRSLYRTYVQLERDARRSTASRDYFAEKLHALPAQELPRGLSTGDGAGELGQVDVEISRELSSGLISLARRADVPLKSVLLGAHLRVLSSLHDSSDVLTGLIANGRVEEEDGERALGMFLNTLPFRLSLQQRDSWLDLVRTVFDEEKTLLPHRRFPLTDALGHTERAPFETAFDFVHFHVFKEVLDLGLVQSLGGTFFERTNFTLLANFSLELDGRSVRLTLDYDDGALSPAQVEAIAGHYREVLRRMATAPDEEYMRRPTLPESELNIVASDAHAPVLRSQALPIHRRIEHWAHLQPEQTAAVFASRRLTYGELDRRANALAHRLIARGIERGDFVGITIDRSLEAVIAVLGVLKAGAAYVPIDPSHPQERRAYMIADARLAAVLGPTDLADDAETPLRPERSIDGAMPAYAIYTSGSTGHPKAVVISHANLESAYLAWETVYGLTSGVRAHLQTASLGFDVFTGDFVRALGSGGRLVICPTEERLVPEKLYGLMKTEEVEFAEMVPALMRGLAAHLQRVGGDLSFLRILVLGSDSWNVDEYARFSALLDPRCRFINSYGLTEATIDSAFFEGAPPCHGLVPIGRRYPNTQLYVLDRKRELSPLGVHGELFVGGEGVGQGYLNKPRLTAERYLPDPFSARPGARLYQTGDRARRLPSGDIEFLGRADRQVKIRGFRIELGEIEARLRRHPELEQVVVAAKQTANTSPRLVAYVVAQRELPPREALRSFLSADLPSYMIPSAFVALTEFPLTANGKVDVLRLPDPGSECLARPAPVPPRSEVEQVLVAIWKEVLKLESVGTEDDFFELGGDSIVAMRVMAKAREAGWSLSTRTLFDRHTISALAKSARLPGPAAPEQTPVGTVALAPIQRWFFEQRTIDRHHYNQSVLLEVPRDLDSGRLESAFALLVDHHDALRSRFIDVDGQMQGTIVAVETAAVLRVVELAHPAELEKFGTDFKAELDLARGPLLRAALVNFPEAQSSRLLMTIHHLVVDGVSWRILLEDLEYFYKTLETTATPTPPVKSTSLRAWTAKLSDAAANVDSGEYAYWRSLVNAGEVALPRDFTPSAENFVGRAASCSSTLDRSRTERLLRQKPEELLLAALTKTVCAWSEQRALLVSLERHGRDAFCEELDVSRTVGWFTAEFPLLLELPERAATLLPSIRAQLQKVPRGGLGYGLLAYLSPNPAIRTELAKIPKPDIAFNYLGQLDRIFERDAIFAAADESSGPDQSPRAIRDQLLDVNAFVSAGELHIEWTYASDAYQRSTIEHLAEQLLDALAVLIEQHQPPTDPGDQSARGRESVMPMQGPTSNSSYRPIVTLQECGAGAPLFLIPGAAGAVGYLAPLATALGNTRPILALEARGLSGDDSPFASIEEMAAEYVHAIRARTSAPLLIAGHSFGGWVAFEVARQLETLGARVALTAIIDMEAPGELATVSPQQGWFDAFVATVEELFEIDLALNDPRARPTTLEEKLARLHRALVDADLLPAQGGWARLQGILNVFKADLRGRYRPGDARISRLSLFTAASGLGAVSNHDAFGWRMRSDHGVEQEQVPGDHLTMLRPPRVAVLAQRLQAHLAKALERVEP